MDSQVFSVSHLVSAFFKIEPRGGRQIRGKAIHTRGSNAVGQACCKVTASTVNLLGPDLDTDLALLNSILLI